MRIIAGKHKSRKLLSLPGETTRPMMDSMKETVFNIIGPYFNQISVLDLFGGSGALSLEALSRGASKATIVEVSKDALKVIEANANALKEEENIFLLSTSYEEGVRRLIGQKFDLVFLDPPFKLVIINDIIETLLEHKMLAKGAYVVCQYKRGNMQPVSHLNLIKNKIYGNNELSIYQNG